MTSDTRTQYFFITVEQLMATFTWLSFIDRCLKDWPVVVKMVEMIIIGKMKQKR